MFEDAKLIYSYTRAQALEDGVLVDASTLAKECGFRNPVALTQGAWEAVVHTSEEDAKDGQSETGRLWDVLNMLRFEIMRYAGEDDLHFALSVWKSGTPADHRLKALCHGGDAGEQVMTIMLPHED